MNATDPHLRKLLDERGQAVHVSVSDLADRAIARDRRNHRRRVTTMAVAGALALAVAAPIGWNLLGTPRSGQVPAGPSTSVNSAPNPSQTTSAPSRTAGPPQNRTTPTIRATGSDTAVVLTPPSGRATGMSAVAFAVDGAFHDGDRTIDLPEGTVEPVQVARLGSGVVGMTQDPEGLAVFVVDDSGKLVRRIGKAAELTVSSDTSRFVVSDSAGGLTFHDETGRSLAKLPALGATSTAPGGFIPVGIMGDLVMAVDRREQRGSIAWNTSTGEVTAIKGIVEAVDGRTRLAVFKVGTDAKPCHELRDFTTASLAHAPVHWRLCGPITPRSFSQDGTHLVGTGFSDGMPGELMNGADGQPLYADTVVLRVSDAEVVAELSGSSFLGLHAQMSDASHGLTAQVSAGQGKRVLVQCRLDGDCAVVGEARLAYQPDIPESAGPYVLSDN